MKSRGVNERSKTGISFPTFLLLVISPRLHTLLSLFFVRLVSWSSDSFRTRFSSLYPLKMDSKSKTQVDFLEESVLLEETQYQEGFKEGYNDGLIPGKEEAKDVGLKTGFQTGEELGFYKGCITIWDSILRIDPRSFSSRVCKDIEKLGELVERFPLMDPENEDVQEGMERIRLKFRVVCANLGVKLEYDGQPSSSKRDVEDL